MKKSIAFECPLLLPLNKWVGGNIFAQIPKKDTLTWTDLKYETKNFKFSSHDFS
jgi:hypothetical protein